MIRKIFPRATISAGRLVLRPFEPRDALDVYATWNDDAYSRFVPAAMAAAHTDLEHATKWCCRGVEEWREIGEGIAFAAEDVGARRLAAHVSLFNADWSAMTTEVHYWTAPWARGNGYATEAVRAVARWALTECGFVRVALATVTANAGSRKVAERAGFRYEGTLRKAAVTGAGREDLAIFSLISADL
jgi:RimJ/RimL family protein N-acetyltransferase